MFIDESKKLSIEYRDRGKLSIGILPWDILTSILDK